MREWIGSLTILTSYHKHKCWRIVLTQSRNIYKISFKYASTNAGCKKTISLRPSVSIHVYLWKGNDSTFFRKVITMWIKYQTTWTFFYWCCLCVSSGDIELGQHRLRYLLVAVKQYKDLRFRQELQRFKDTKCITTLKMCLFKTESRCPRTNGLITNWRLFRLCRTRGPNRQFNLLCKLTARR